MASEFVVVERELLERVSLRLGQHEPHWDAAGTRGANCPECIRQRDTRLEIVAALDAPGPEPADLEYVAALCPKCLKHTEEPDTLCCGVGSKLVVWLDDARRIEASLPQPVAGMMETAAELFKDARPSTAEERAQMKRPGISPAAPPDVAGSEFAHLRKTNVARCETWHTLEAWSETDWACATAGEVGELCNLIKKRRRGEEIPIKDVADEMADVIIYLDLLAARCGIDLWAATVSKFNEFSEKRGMDIFLSQHPPDAGAGEKGRCEITGNPYGTDTRPVVNGIIVGCQCATCREAEGRPRP